MNLNRSQKYQELKRIAADFGYLASSGRWFKESYHSDLLAKRVATSMLRADHGGLARYIEFASLSFSQNGEDILVEAIFAGKQKGFYIDVGAHHPFKYSNTALLSLRGWTGINIEPNPDSISLFKINRPNDKNVNIGIASMRSEIEYYMFKESAYNTFSEALASERQQRNYSPFLGTRKIPVAPLSDILAEIPREADIDFMSVDCEAFDEIVLRSNNWDVYRPWLIAVECLAHLGEKQFLSDPCSICAFLEGVGYSKKFVCMWTQFFIDTTKPYPASLRDYSKVELVSSL